MVRLVFRPYTQVWRSICTSESRRTSTRVSSGFILLRHSSPSFGSQHVRSFAATLQCNHDRTVLRQSKCPGSHLSHPAVTFTFISPLSFVELNDLRTCWTPWSVFQDGSGRLTTVRLGLKCHETGTQYQLNQSTLPGSNTSMKANMNAQVSLALALAIQDRHVYINQDLLVRKRITVPNQGLLEHIHSNRSRRSTGKKCNRHWRLKQ